MRLTARLSLTFLALTFAAPGCVKRQQHVTLKPDPTAPATDPERVVLDSAVANRFVRAEAAGEILARLRIATQGESDRPRPPANVALVMDTSASMRGEAIDEAKKAALVLVDALGNGDTLSVVVFGSRTETLVPAVTLDDAVRGKIRATLEKIQAHGTTDLGGGLAAGLAELGKARASGREMLHRVVLLSDGVPNEAASIASLAAQAASIPAPITALGLGLEYHETLLAQLAQTTGGRFHFVEDATAVATVFADEVLDLDRIVAQSVQLDLRPGPGVNILEVVGYTPSALDRGSTIALGDLYEGQAHEVLVRLSVGEHKPGATVELLDADLRFTDATTASGHGFERQRFLSVEATDDAEELAAGRDEELEQTAVRVQTASATLQIMSLARSGQMDAAKAELVRARKTAEALVKRTDDAELSQMVADLHKLEKTLPELAPPQPAPATQHMASPTSGSKASMADEGPAPAPVPTDSARHNRSTHSKAYQMVHGDR